MSAPRRKNVARYIYTDEADRFWVLALGVNERDDRHTPVNEWIQLPHGATIHDAKQLLDEVHSDLALGRFRIERYDRRKPTLAAALEDLLDKRQDNKECTHRWWRQHAGDWLDRLGPIEAHRVDHFDVTEWWRNLRNQKSPGVCNDALTTLRATIDHAERLGWRDTANPAKTIKRAKVPHANARPLITPEDWVRIAAWLRWEDERRIRATSEAPHRHKGMRWAYMGHYPYAVTQVLLAARGAEVCGLAWHDIDWERRIITLRETKTAPTLERVVSRDLLDVLQVHQERLIRYGTKAAGVSTLVFPSLHGTRTDPNTRFKTAWNRCLEGLGYPVGRAQGGWVPHDLRRLGIDRLYAAGADTRVAMEFVGHSIADVHARYLRGTHESVVEITRSIASEMVLEASDLKSSPVIPAMPASRRRKP